MLYLSCYRTWQELSHFGVVSLTGEACNIGTRILCDLTERGCCYIRDALALPRDTKFNKQHNSRSIAGEHVGSIMLPKSMYRDLAITLCFLYGYDYVVEDKDGNLVAWYIKINDIVTEDHTEMMEVMQRWSELDIPYLRWYHSSNPHVGIANVHAMTGRVS